MNYISREKLIDLILVNEDLWYGDDDNLYGDTNEPPEEVGPLYKKSAKLKGKTPLVPLIKLKNASAAAPSASDPQMAQLVISSELFAEFGIIPARISSKLAAYNDSNEKEMSTNLKMAQELFGVAPGDKPMPGVKKPFFAPGTSIEEVMDIIDNSVSELEKIYKVRLDVIIGSEQFKHGSDKGKNIPWLAYLRIDPASKKDPKLTKIFPEGVNGQLLQNIASYCAENHVSGDVNSIYSDVYEHLKDVYLSNKFKTPAVYSKYIERNEQVRNRLESSALSKYFKKLMATSEVSTTDDIAAKLAAIFRGSMTKKIKGNAKTVLHHKVSERMGELRKYLENFPKFLQFIKATLPMRYEDILNNFGMDEEELSQFRTFGEFASYVYADTTLASELYSRANVDERSRVKGDQRQGTEMAVNARAINKQLANARSGKGRKGASVAQKRERMEELRVDIEARKEDIADLKEELKAATPEEAPEIEAKIKELAAQNFKDGKTIAALKLQVKKAIAANPEAEHEDADDKQERRTRELEDKLHNIISTRLASIEDQNAAEAFLDRNDKSGEHRKRMAMGSDYGSERIITKFTVTVPGAVLGGNVKLKKQLETHFTKRANAFGKKLNDAETARGKEALTDVYCDTLDSRDGGMKVLVEIEYPEKSITAKQIKSSIYDLINAMLKPFPKEAGIKASAPEIGVQ